MKAFIKGTFFLMFVIFLSKLLGFLFRMQFVQIAGEEAVGYYMASYPTFIFFISIVQFGLPVAISKIVAMYFVTNKEKIPAVMKTVFRFATFSCLVLLPLLFFTVPFIAGTLLHNQALVPLLLVSLCAIPFVIFSSIYKAYLQGLMKITSTALSQLIEQLSRICMIVFFLPFFVTTTNPIVLATVVMIFTVLSEMIAFLILAFTYYRHKFSSADRAYYPLKPILQTALPSQGSRLFGTFTWFLEPIIFLKALTSTGLTVAAATSIYGIISGIHIPLLLFPAFIPAALAIVLIPAISESLAKNHTKSAQLRTLLSIRLSSLTGAFACTIFFLYGDALAIKLFHITESHYMKLLAPIFYFYYIQSPMHAILQASGEAKSAMMNSIYGGFSKLFIMFVLASQPALQEKGAMIAIGFGVVMTSLLHIVTIKKIAAFPFQLLTIIGPYLLFIAVSLLLSFYSLPFTLLVQILLTIVILIIFSFLLRQITFSELAYLYKRLKRL